MDLNDEQKQKVSQWLDEGLKLSDIQTRIADELGLKLTYMEVRFLVDDLHLTPKDVESPTENASPDLPPPPQAPPPAASDGPAGTAPLDVVDEALNESATGGGVKVAVDSITKPGAIVSGRVTFSDGNNADWYLDQTGRLGLAPATKGYRPSATDVQEFQMALEKELSGLGM